ncbi:MAG: hypothetical protein KGI66_01925, partial [Patescibacteria group bacterium]|nr:hypothetical protein [Patescibacteria group bacterium]
MKNRSLVNRVAALTGILLGAFALSALANWTAPLNPPPTCISGDPGCDAPINVGPVAQYKVGPGGIGIGASSGMDAGTLLDVFGTAVAQDFWTNTLHVKGSAQTLGKGYVLTDVNGDGNATWQPSTGGSGSSTSGVTSIKSGSTDNITVSPTTGNVVISAHGTVGGGCYQDGGTKTWGNASTNSLGSCICPSQYTAQKISGGQVIGTSGTIA